MESLLEYSTNPLVLFLMIIVVAWVWEDASLVSGALLAADEKISVLAAVLAIFIGICSGDLGLYYLGRLAHRWRRLRAWILTNPKSRQLSRRFRRSTVANIFIIRFIPGLRSLGFTMCGIWRISLHRFLFAMTAAGVFWIAVVFTLVYNLGSSPWLEGSDWKWSLMGLALVLLVFNNFWVHRRARGIKK